MKRLKLIRPEDVYITSLAWRRITADRNNGIPHPEITDIRLTGNSFFDFFASCVEHGGGIIAKNIALQMGVKPHLLSPAIEAMSGLPAHEWAVRYVHMAACNRLWGDRSTGYISSLASSLGFRTVGGFSHFFYRMEHCTPTDFVNMNRNHCRWLH
jgi:AraC-like DNA-binding protein